MAAKKKRATDTGAGTTGKTGKAGKSGKSGKPGSLGKLAAMMRGIDLCMMSTNGTNGGIHTRPMSNNGEVDFDGDAWFFSWRKSQKVRDLEKDAHVALAYQGGKKTAPVWIAVRGKGSIVDDVAKKKELWLKELDRWFDKGPEDPQVVLIRVRAAHAAWWSYEEQGELSLKTKAKKTKKSG